MMMLMSMSGKFVHKLKPDLVAAGVKEKYVFQKMGLPFRQMHSWDYSGDHTMGMMHSQYSQKIWI